jgi:glutamate formiminotransferase
MSPVACVPNVSEGRRADVIAACARAIEAAGVALLNVDSDASHHRTVYTFAGAPEEVRRGALALFDAALPAIDLREHTGAHPRIGAVDVMPFVPVADTPMSVCVALARGVAQEVAVRHRLPVFLYEETATAPHRRRLEDIRRGQFEGLAAKLRQPEWAPDFGPAEPHPSAGAVVIGARRPLVAYNVNLGTTRIDVAEQIARVVRESSGGLPFVKALAIDLSDRGLVQVSMNLTNVDETPIARVFELVKREAARHGVAVVESEIVGLVPSSAVAATFASYLQLRDFTDRKILERLMKT